MFRPHNRKPDFKNLEAVLEKKVPSRPTLFELFLNNRLHKQLANEDECKTYKAYANQEAVIVAYANAGYDYATIRGSSFFFKDADNHVLQTKSLNEGFVITDRDSFNSFVWRNPLDYDYSILERVNEIMEDGMKVIPIGPGGVLENVIELVGYENLCFMIYEDPELVSDIFECVGSRLLSYYEKCLEYKSVGAIMSNDDWGFNKQTMLSPNDMRKYVFPWHKKIVEAAHKSGRYALLHSCGYYRDIIDDLLIDMKYDARHSYEDNIVPVEKAYEELKGKIGVLGGIDVNFMVNASEQEIFHRAKAMIERSSASGGYALGTGNSVPEYIPDSHYYAMISAAWKSSLDESDLKCCKP